MQVSLRKCTYGCNSNHSNGSIITYHTVTTFTLTCFPCCPNLMLIQVIAHFHVIVTHMSCVFCKNGGRTTHTHTEKPVKEYLEVKMFTNDHLIIIASDNIMHEYFIARTRTTTTMMMMMVQIVKRGRWL